MNTKVPLCLLASGSLINMDGMFSSTFPQLEGLQIMEDYTKVSPCHNASIPFRKQRITGKQKTLYQVALASLLCVA